MATHEVVAKQFEILVAECRSILHSCGWDGSSFDRSFPPNEAYLRLRTQVRNIVRRVCGEDSPHYQELRRLAETKETATNSYYLPHILGVVEAAQRDFLAGLLFDLRALVAAEILGDFIDQADTLVREGYHPAAASLAGAVLEDALRKLSAARGIPVPERTGIDRLNAELAKAGVYETHMQKRIVALADIRNNADHGRFDKFTRDDVEDMVKWVRRFASDYLR